jgi:hypothetical protein
MTVKIDINSITSALLAESFVDYMLIADASSKFDLD